MSDTLVCPPDPPPLSNPLLERVDFLRLDAARRLHPETKTELGQFFTPAAVAEFMASQLVVAGPVVRLLDPGAGVGSLFAAVVAALCRREARPAEIHVTAYEVDPLLAGYLQDTLRLCREACERCGIAFHGELRSVDFIESAVADLRGGLFSEGGTLPFDAAILNPPYLKIRTDSATRSRLRCIGMETSNLYTAFLAAAYRLLAPEGELVAITPRSFCNGPYFRPFREDFLATMSLRRLHLFDSREAAFAEDAVLQENLIFRAVKSSVPPAHVEITANAGPSDGYLSVRKVPYPQVVHPGDAQRFIHIVPDELGQQVVARMAGFRASLADLGLTVSTGRVVDFRAREFLRAEPEAGAAALIYPTHFTAAGLRWPRLDSRKPNALAVTARSADLLVPNADYVLVKRFSSKEERKRIVAAVFRKGQTPGEGVAFENHLNYFHCAGQGLEPAVARGLAAFLNWSLVDTHFRHFNGHTQVNATDLRNMRYPTLAQLRELGQQVTDDLSDQQRLDETVERVLIAMDDTHDLNPRRVQRRIDEAQEVLAALGLPKGQLNERSALTLLALLNLSPGDAWSAGAAPLLGITPIMEFIAREYGKTYAPNTRETVRRFTVHQFLEAGLLEANPDHPARAVNSPKNVYRVRSEALELLRTYGAPEWEARLRTFLASVETLKTRYAREREMNRIPVEVAPGQVITLSPGGQNVLVEQLIREFAPRFTPGGRLLYVGDTDEKFAHCDAAGLAALGVRFDTHGKMPDVIIHHAEKNWLLLIEAVTSHGPVSPKRRRELETLFAGSTAGLVFVTAFLTRRAMVQYLDDLSWETEVWVADAPSHMIHFNGERFLGPYE